MRIVRVYVLVLLLLSTGMGMAAEQYKDFPIGTVPRSFKKFKVANPSFRYFKPSKGPKKMPLLIWLHGSGGFGKGVENWQPPTCAMIRDYKLPLMVVEPRKQIKMGWWHDEVLKIIEYVQTQHSIDPDRIYLGGYSQGAGATWVVASKYPDVFAAITTLAGGGRPDASTKCLTNMPIWCFHGDIDRTVPLDSTKRMYDFLINNGSKLITFTTLKGQGHNIHRTRVATQPALFEWMLKQKRGAATNFRPTASIKIPKKQAENKTKKS